MTYREEEIKNLLAKHSENPEQWVLNAREHHKTLKALVTGEGFHDELINKIEHLESTQRAKVREKYSKDIRDLFSRIMKKRQNVFDANGGSVNSTINSDTIIKELNEVLSNFKDNKSLFKYLSEFYFQLDDIDPNGVIMLEYKTEPEEDVYPVYRSINDIRHYQSKGQLVDYIVFEPEIREDTLIKKWRFIDDAKDYTFTELDGVFTLYEDDTFEHPFGEVPVLILSEKRKVGTEERYSPLNDITELAKDYARDKSVLTIYKFQKGTPLHWRYGSVKCKDCNGLSKKGSSTCTTCDGTGQPKKTDVSDVNYIPIPKEGQPFIGEKIGGFISPDLETWKQYKEDLRDMEILIDDTIWGTDKYNKFQNNKLTATEVVVDLQPVNNTLSVFSDVAEYAYNTLSNWILNFIDKTKDKKELEYTRVFGRRYVIESPDVLLEKYSNAKEKGDNNTVLDKLLEEFILSKYKSDPVMQEKMVKKSCVEPYVHLSVKEVYDMYGAVESNKKVLFQKFWRQANTDKKVDILENEFNEYFNTNNTITNESSTKETTPNEE